MLKLSDLSVNNYNKGIYNTCFFTFLLKNVIIFQNILALFKKNSNFADKFSI